MEETWLEVILVEMSLVKEYHFSPFQSTFRKWTQYHIVYGLHV